MVEPLGTRVGFLVLGVGALVSDCGRNYLGIVEPGVDLLALLQVHI